MADQNQDQGQQQPKQPSTANTFSGGMVKDPLDLFKKDNSYTHARNMVNYLSDGEIGGKSAEPSNLFSCAAPYTIIGCIHLAEDEWAIFSTDNTHSEIGFLIDGTNSYSTLMNDSATIAAGLPGLNFNTSNLITGQARRGFECGFDVYWSDGQRNPDRVLNTATCPFTSTAKVYPNPWVQNCTLSAGCYTCVNTNKIDADQLRLAPLLDTPCIKLSRHQGPGQLPNGSYQICMAYAMNGIKMTDYIAFSDVYSAWTHLNNGGSIDITISNISDQCKIRFTEMELVVISLVNQQVEAKRLGIYSTAQGVINLSLVDRTLPNIPIEKLPINNPIIVSCDAIFGLSNYLTRVGPKMRPDINYQPLANQIRANWCAVMYNEKYYHAGGDQFGMNVGYLRGEVYAFYIRWIYNTGDKSADYPIPGLPAGTVPTLAPAGSWPVSQDTGQVIAAGRFGGYSSTEIYPDRTPAVWGALCGQPIMWHRFPDQTDFGGSILSHFNPLGGAPPGQGFISVLGAYFTNIQPPVDNNGNIVTDIVGYEILRAVRDGHESIIAKGMINNMKQVSDNIGTPQVLQNYPYNDLGIDVFLTNNFGNITTGTVGNGFNSPVPGYPAGFNQNMWSFHSPDTTFNHPYLGTGTLNIECIMNGLSQGIFREPWKHPMFKVLSDFDSWLGTTLTLIEGFVQAINLIANVSGAINGDPISQVSLSATEAIPINFPLLGNPVPMTNVVGTSTTDYATTTPINIAIGVANAAILGLMLTIQLPAFEEQVLTVIKGLIPGRQYALQYNSFGNYTQSIGTGKITGFVNDYMYIKNRVQQFAGMTVNNLYRNEYVAVNLDNVIPPYFGDQQSRFNLAAGALSPGAWYSKNIGSYYASYRVAQTAQYGQVDSPKQVPIGCVQQVNVGSVAASGPATFSSPIMFGGDTYINRYTEKNPMMFFNDWLVNAPEDFKYDYRNYINVPYPMFWLNNDTVSYDILSLAHQNRRLDGPMNKKLFYVNNGYFYLFCNGVRDFFVESSVNVGYRDWEEETAKRFYDPYGASATFIDEMFRSDIIKSDTLYKYDYSLSSNRFINQYISWGQCLRRDYDPQLAYTCFDYFPRRVAYSLPQNEEQMQDNWRLFLPNNYKNFDDNVYAIKDLHKTGAIFLMEHDSPYILPGVETMPSKNSTDYTVGTGKLFDQNLQSLSNVDDPYEYGSCQSRLGVVNTSSGIFWVSQDTGKLFTLREGKPFDVGQEAGMKFWLQKYLPSQLLQAIPTFPLFDNPVAGVGVQLLYDSVTEVLYITKKDYVPKPNMGITFSGGIFYGGCPPGSAFAGYDPVTGGILCAACLCGIKCCPGVPITLGDPAYFDDASWTLSYDCKRKEFISFHDWHPNYNVPTRDHLLTIVGNQLWRHNSTVQSYCNFYNNSYPCEIEYFTSTGVTDTILQSVEWLLESYQYTPNGFDKFLNFDENFDYVMLYNKEQNSTLQNMLLKPWDDPYAANNYPQFIGPTRTVLYSKVENKYRLNDFYDFTNDRGQFTLANVPMITTDPNGYTFTTNTAYFNLLKPWNQQKRMRYFGTRIFMRRSSLGKNSLTIRYASTKNQFSPR